MIVARWLLFAIFGCRRLSANGQTDRRRKAILFGGEVIRS